MEHVRISDEHAQADACPEGIAPSIMTEKDLVPPDQCERCGGASSVITVRARGTTLWRNGWLVRRRECLKCGHRWNTWESSVFHPIRVCRELKSRTDIADPDEMIRKLTGQSRPREE